VSGVATGNRCPRTRLPFLPTSERPTVSGLLLLLRAACLQRHCLLCAVLLAQAPDS
jgi:hypothetical protein